MNRDAISHSTFERGKTKTPILRGEERDGNSLPPMSALSTMERVVEIVTRLLIYPAPRFGDPENGERKNIGEKRGGALDTRGDDSGPQIPQKLS